MPRCIVYSSAMRWRFDLMYTVAWVECERNPGFTSLNPGYGVAES